MTREMPLILPCPVIPDSCRVFLLNDPIIDCWITEKTGVYTNCLFRGKHLAITFLLHILATHGLHHGFQYNMLHNLNNWYMVSIKNILIFT